MLTKYQKNDILIGVVLWNHIWSLRTHFSSGEGGLVARPDPVTVRTAAYLFGTRGERGFLKGGCCGEHTTDNEGVEHDASHRTGHPGHHRGFCHKCQRWRTG